MGYGGCCYNGYCACKWRGECGVVESVRWGWVLSVMVWILWNEIGSLEIILTWGSLLSFLYLSLFSILLPFAASFDTIRIIVAFTESISFVVCTRGCRHDLMLLIPKLPLSKLFWNLTIKRYKNIPPNSDLYLPVSESSSNQFPPYAQRCVMGFIGFPMELHCSQVLLLWDCPSPTIIDFTQSTINLLPSLAMTQ